MPAYDYNFSFGSLAIISWVFAIIGIGLHIGLAFVVAHLANKKGYSYGGFWALSFFAGFIIGLIVVLCLTDKTVPPPYQSYQPPYQQPYQPQPAQAVCPNCASSIPGDSVYCSKCRTKIK